MTAVKGFHISYEGSDQERKNNIANITIPDRGDVKYHQPIWPGYFARVGQPDSTTWHYRGYLPDTKRVWQAYYRFVIRHPIRACIGCGQFFQNLTYRVFGSVVGEQVSLPIVLLTPALAIIAPILGLIAVSVARIPRFRKLTPPLFQPFTLMGWSNYCTMLALVFMWHGYKQHKAKLHPLQCLRHSSKIFWNDFFTDNLSNSHRSTTILSTFRQDKFSSPIPHQDIIVKPESGGAGYKLRSLRWDDMARVYRCKDTERKISEPEVFTPYELELYIRSHKINFLVEQWETPRSPLPVSTLRILTVNFSGKSELLSAVFLPAPRNSISTAYFDLDGYLINFQDSCVGEPFKHGSNGNLTGIPLPELNSVIGNCLNMHTLLSGHIEISWDILLTDDGPVYLEGNVFPPGCDYKLSVFKNDSNLDCIRTRMLHEFSGINY